MRTRLAVLGLATALAMSIGLWPGPAHAAIQTKGYRCEGVQVFRCAYMHFDTDNVRVRGYANIIDVDPAWQVAVNEVRVQSSYYLDPASWTTESRTDDFDGYHATEDGAQTGLVSCTGRFYRVVYHWSARHSNGNTESGDERSNAFLC